jgi:hypothetical protein
MKRIALLSLIIVLTVSGKSYGQKQFNNWLFGDHAGITFNTTPPTVILTSATNDWEGTVSISDPTTGELLFYSNGETVWNRNNQPMPNGTGLFGSTSSVQSALAIRSLVDTSIYYLFTVDQSGYFWPSRGFNYSIVDMRLNNGLGDILCKNIPVLDSAAEALQAIPMSSQKGYWIIVRQMNSNAFYTYALSGAGLSPNAVISAVGAPIGIKDGGTCGIASTRDGRHIGFSALMIPLLELFDFDPGTGVVSNPVPLPVFPSPYVYLTAFSPDGRYLYTGYTNDSTIAQFDITENPTQIANSMIMLATKTRDVGDGPRALMQAPDDKIYIGDGRYKWLSSVDDPNVRGIGAQFEDKGFDLKTGSGLAGLPNIPAPLLGKDWLTDDVSNDVTGPSIVSFNTDTIGADYYLYLKVPVSDEQNPVHIVLSWTPSTISYASAYSGLFLQLQPQVTMSPGALSLDIDRTSFDSIIIIDFKVNTFAGSITMSLDSIPISIVPNCLSVYKNATITSSFACGYSTLFSYLKTGKIPLEIKSIIPNPFSQSTTIKFTSLGQSFTQVSIHNLLGSEVGRLFSGELDAGEHSITWDASGMAVGMYFCVISSNGRTENLPIMLLR